MPEQVIPKPTLGRIVHYFMDAGGGNVAPVPAIIVYVFPDNSRAMVNLQVMNDGPVPTRWATSVPYGTKHNCWYWPPLTKEEITVEAIY